MPHKLALPRGWKRRVCSSVVQNAVWIAYPLYWSSDIGHRRAAVQPPLSQCIRISAISQSEEVL